MFIHVQEFAQLLGLTPFEEVPVGQMSHSPFDPQWWIPDANISSVVVRVETVVNIADVLLVSTFVCYDTFRRHICGGLANHSSELCTALYSRYRQRRSRPSNRLWRQRTTGFCIGDNLASIMSQGQTLWIPLLIRCVDMRANSLVPELLITVSLVIISIS